MPAPEHANLLTALKTPHSVSLNFQHPWMPRLVNIYNLGYHCCPQHWVCICAVHSHLGHIWCHLSLVRHGRCWLLPLLQDGLH